MLRGSASSVNTAPAIAWRQHTLDNVLGLAQLVLAGNVQQLVQVLKVPNFGNVLVVRGELKLKHVAEVVVACSSRVDSNAVSDG